MQTNIIKEKYSSNFLLKLIPESNYDKLKSESLKAMIELNEMKQDMKNKFQKKLNENETKLKLTKQYILDETNKAIAILKENEAMLIKKCDVIFFLSQIPSIAFSIKSEAIDS